MRSFLAAFQFLTVIPLGPLGRVTSSSKEGEAEVDDKGRAALSSAMAFFPIVGALQGALLVGVDLLLGAVFPTTVVSGILVAVLVLTNNGFHLDGLADSIDGLAGGRTKEDRLRIMRDSFIGPMGVIAITLVLLLKYLCISSLTGPMRAEFIFLFPMIGRYAMVPMSRLAPYARSGGLGSAFSATSNPALIFSSATALALVLIFIGMPGLVIFLLLLVLVYFISIFFKKRIGGVTGDVFGFGSEVAEVFFLLLALIVTVTP